MLVMYTLISSKSMPSGAVSEPLTVAIVPGASTLMPKLNRTWWGALGERKLLLDPLGG